MNGKIILLMICSMVTIMFMLFGAFIGVINYEFEIDKCENMKSGNYEFSHDVQLNIQYTSNCYYYTHHNFALIGNILY